LYEPMVVRPNTAASAVWDAPASSVLNGAYDATNETTDCDVLPPPPPPPLNGLTAVHVHDSAWVGLRVFLR
jgi:hypothetical protein